MNYLHILLLCLAGLVLPAIARSQISTVQGQSLDSLINWLGEHIYDPADSIYVLAHRALYQAMESGTPAQVAQCHNNLAAWHYGHAESEDQDSILYHDQKALEYFLLARDTASAAGAYLQVGSDLVSSNEYQKAQNLIFQGIELYEQLEMPDRIAGAYAKLSFLFRNMGDLDKAMEYGERSVTMFQKEAPEGYVVEPLLYLISAYTDAGQADAAIGRANLALEEIANAGGKEEDPGGYLRVVGLRGKAYESKEQLNLAMADYEEAWAFAKSLVEKEEQADGYKGDIGSVLRKQGKYTEAIPYLEDYLNHLSERNYSATTWQQFLSLAECYEQTNQPNKALQATQRGWTVRDSMLNGRIDALETELEVKYATAQKEETIASQEARIGQQRRIVWLALGGLLLLACIAVIIWLAYRRNQRLAKALANKNEENEVLLKEIHHRVKNNLQVISSLLSLQSAQVQDPTVRSSVLESQNRVRSMALIHQKLYQNDNLAAIEMKDYFETLGRSILKSFGASSKRIELVTPMEELELDVDTAIPVGLIVNELITNSMKYAFGNKQEGEIRISLQREHPDHLTLVVADSGPGLSATPEEPDPASGFGSQLVHLLTIQLNGQLETKQEKGMVTTLRFEPTKNEAA
jgi:two-component sensor histidine kinase/tetratricopeptide (TPR) repeat protein